MTDGIRTLALAPNGVTEVEVSDDGFTTEGAMQNEPSEFAKAVFNLCAPGGQTPEAMEAVVRAMAKPCDCENCEMDERERKHRTEMEREQAIRLAREALEQARRREWECEVAVYEAEGRGGDSYARMLRARLDGDREAEVSAEVDFYAERFLDANVTPPTRIAERVTSKVAALRIERERH